MRSAFAKDFARSIAGSLGRFLAIAGIVALGAGFYAGLRMTAPDMRIAADEYYDGTALMDVRVLSTLGFSDAGIEELRGVEGVEAVMPARETDVMGAIAGEQYVVRLHSLPEAASSSSSSDGVAVASDDADYLNRLVLAEGEWPDAPGEVVVSADSVTKAPFSVGDTIEVVDCSQDMESTLAVTELTITGTVHASYYTTLTSLGSSSLGSGSVQQVAYAAEGTFAGDMPYTEAFLSVSGARDHFAFSDAYDEAVSQVTDRLEAAAPDIAAARTDEVRGEAQRAVDDARAELDAARAEAGAELADARASLDAAAGLIAQSEAQLSAGETEYAAAETELARQREDAKSQISAAEGQLAALKEQHPEAVEQITALEAQIEAARAAAQEELAAAEGQLAASRATLDAGWAELEGARATYAQGEADYEAARADADARLSDAEAELVRAQADVDAIEQASVYVLDRSKNIGAASFEADSGRIDSIASFFPLIFFLVAALVALTTMTRMVDEDRVLIGTYKALGYSRARITGKYVGYAALASVAGGVVGIAVLSQVLPWVIQNAYAIIYIVPIVPAGRLPVDPGIAGASLAVGVGVTLLATWAAAAAVLAERPAALMLPRAPKAGKRILLERLGPAWRRLSFSWKVCARNLFRYKKRFVMTVIGIAGCTALLLTGLGLSNAINDIIDNQFGKITVYNLSVTMDSDASDEAQDRIEETLDDSPAIERWTRVHSEPLVARAQAQAAADAEGDVAELAATLVVPSDPSSMASYVFMKPRLSDTPISMGTDSVVVTEKLARELGVGPGDSLALVGTDDAGNATGASRSVAVTDVMENYVEHYVFMGPAAYEAAFGSAPSAETVFAVASDDAAARESLLTALLGDESVKTAAYNDETIDTYRTMIESVNVIVVVLVVAAAALAFIVLYNLTNINIAEREREIATLKVLGFFPREVDAYIYREVVILSLIGALIGLVLGVFLEGYVVATAEVDQVMFGRAVHPASFIAAFALTMAFTGAVLAAMRRKLRRIDMVESLKSVE